MSVPGGEAIDPQNRTDPKTVQEAVCEIEYNVMLWDLHRRLYDRAAFGIGFLELGLGSAALYTAVNLKHWTGAIGLVLGTLTIINNLWGPGKKSTGALYAKKRYAEFRANSEGLTVEQIGSRLATMDADDPPVIKGLRAVAYNCAVESRSRYAFRRKLNLWEHLLKLLA